MNQINPQNQGVNPFGPAPLDFVSEGILPMAEVGPIDTLILQLNQECQRHLQEAQTLFGKSQQLQAVITHLRELDRRVAELGGIEGIRHLVTALEFFRNQLSDLDERQAQFNQTIEQASQTIEQASQTIEQVNQTIEQGQHLESRIQQAGREQWQRLSSVQQDIQHTYTQTQEVAASIQDRVADMDQIGLQVVHALEGLGGPAILHDIRQAIVGGKELLEDLRAVLATPVPAPEDPTLPFREELAELKEMQQRQGELLNKLTRYLAGQIQTRRTSA